MTGPGRPLDDKGTHEMKSGTGAALARHFFLVLLLLGAAAALATWRGALWPFGLRATLLMTLSGLVGLAQGWGVIWLIPVAVAAALPDARWRLISWPLVVAGCLALHGAIGPARGFVPLSHLGLGQAITLYAIPAALALVAGSALRIVANAVVLRSQTQP